MDHIDIINLVYRVAEHLDQRQLEAAAELFSQAQVRLEESGTPLNHEQLLQALQHSVYGHTGEPVITRHNISNPIVEVVHDKGIAHCRCSYLVLQGSNDQLLQPIETGRYHDEFVKENGQWCFSSRVCLVEQRQIEQGQVVQKYAAPTVAQEGLPSPNKPERNIPNREKILAAAQQVFSSVGYSDAGIRRIAEVVGLSSTILLRHFGTKAGLFEAALAAAMGEPRQAADRSQFGRHVAGILADPTQINCPHAMSLLATGNEEARAIAIRVLKKYTILPMMEWLGEPYRESRAKQIMALCAGFALYNNQLNISDSKSIDHHMVDWLANSIQAIVDESV